MGTISIRSEQNLAIERKSFLRHLYVDGLTSKECFVIFNLIRKIRSPMAEFFSSQNPKRQFPIGLLVRPIITDIRPRSPVRKRVRVLLKGPPYMQVQTFSNLRLEVAPDGMLELSAKDAESLIKQGWPKLGELPEDELPGYEDGYTEEQNEPWNPKLKYAIGSVESEAEIEQLLAAREAAQAQREKWRLARVAAFLENKV
jgi:hypothetical protein